MLWASFYKTSNYQIERIKIQWKPRSYVRTDRQTDGQTDMTKLISSLRVRIPLFKKRKKKFHVRIKKGSQYLQCSGTYGISQNNYFHHLLGVRNRYAIKC